MAAAICSRPGCTKYLRSDNTKGKCSKNCESPEAPANQRAKGVEGAKAAPRRESERVAAEEPTPVLAATGEATKDSLARFNTVALALGKDPGAILAEFADAWLAELRGRLA